MGVINRSDYFNGCNKTRLFRQSWSPKEEGAVRAILVIVHGYAEHSGRYDHVGRFFAEHGFHVEALDHRAHGKSEGKDTVYSSVDECVEDVDTLVGLATEGHPGKPVFVLGHSMGGLITTTYVLKKKPQVAGILLSGAALKIGDDISPLMIKLSGLIAKIAPKVKTIKLDGDSVSRDPEVVRLYNEDPLNYRGGIPASTGAAMNKAVIWAQQHAAEFALPVRIMFGTSDKLADPEGSRHLYNEASSSDKTLVPYEGLYHEILNEPEKQQVMEECLKWMTERLG